MNDREMCEKRGHLYQPTTASEYHPGDFLMLDHCGQAAPKMDALTPFSVLTPLRIVIDPNEGREWVERINRLAPGYAGDSSVDLANRVYFEKLIGRGLLGGYFDFNTQKPLEAPPIAPPLYVAAILDKELAKIMNLRKKIDAKASLEMLLAMWGLQEHLKG